MKNDNRIAPSLDTGLVLTSGSKSMFEDVAREMEAEIAAEEEAGITSDDAGLARFQAIASEGPFAFPDGFAGFAQDLAAALGGRVMSKEEVASYEASRPVLPVLTKDGTVVMTKDPVDWSYATYAGASDYVIHNLPGVLSVDVARGVQVEIGERGIEEHPLWEQAACLVLAAEGVEVGTCGMSDPFTIDFTMCGPFVPDGRPGMPAGWVSTGSVSSGPMPLQAVIDMARAGTLDDHFRDRAVETGMVEADMVLLPDDWIPGLDDAFDPEGAVPSGYYSDCGDDPAWVAESLLPIAED